MQPSIKKILLSDYLSILLMLAPSVAFLFYGIGRFTGGVPSHHGVVAIKDHGAGLYRVALITTAICMPLLVWRVAWFYRILRWSRHVQAEITSIWFDKDRGRVEFAFTFEGQTITCGKAIMKNKETTNLQRGDLIWLAVDPDKPRRALIRQLYCE